MTFRLRLCAARIAAHGETVGAFALLTLDTARRQAAEADEAVRSGATLPPLHGVPVLAWSLRTVLGLAYVDRVVVVVRDEDRDAVGHLVTEHLPEGREVALVTGGATRHDSEWRGLSALRAPIEAGEVDVAPRLAAGLAELGEQSLERLGVAHGERRVGLGRGGERVADAHVELLLPAREPAAAARREHLGLLDLGQAE